VGIPPGGRGGSWRGIEVVRAGARRMRCEGSMKSGCRGEPLPRVGPRGRGVSRRTKRDSTWARIRGAQQSAEPAARAQGEETGIAPDPLSSARVESSALLPLHEAEKARVRTGGPAEVLTFGDVPAEYRAGIEGCVLFDATDRGAVEVQGPEAIAFLH